MRIFPGQSPGHVVMAALIGIVGGWLFHRLWRAVLSRGLPSRFWLDMPGQLQVMLASEAAADMFRHYRSLLAGIWRYASRNLLAVMAGAAPITLAWLLFDKIVVSGSGELTTPATNPFGSYMGILISACVWRPRQAASLLHSGRGPH